MRFSSFPKVTQLACEWAGILTSLCATKPVFFSHCLQPREAEGANVLLPSHFTEKEAESQNMSRSHSWSVGGPRLQPDPSKSSQARVISGTKRLREYLLTSKAGRKRGDTLKSGRGIYSIHLESFWPESIKYLWRQGWSCPCSYPKLSLFLHMHLKCICKVYWGLELGNALPIREDFLEGCIFNNPQRINTKLNRQSWGCLDTWQVYSPDIRPTHTRWLLWARQDSSAPFTCLVMWFLSCP